MMRLVISADRKAITFDINSIMENDLIKQIIIENFNIIVTIEKKYIWFFISKKFLIMNDNKFKITQELVDDN